MQAESLTVGTAAVRVPVSGLLSEGMTVLGREANSGSVYLGTDSGVTTATGVLIPNGDPGTTAPYFIPGAHFNGSHVYLIADAAAQTVDWCAN